MKSLKLMSMAAVVALVAVPTASQAAEGDCGTKDEIQIAEMTWASAGLLAQSIQKILEKGYGCNASIVPGDTVPTATSMLTKNKPDIAPELWISTATAIWEKILKKGNAYKAGDVFSEGGLEGWYIPDYVAEANPGLKSVTDLPKYAHLFKEAATGDKGRLYVCPPGWACEIVNTNMFKALDLGGKFEAFSPGSGANLKASIARKVTRKEPVVAYYWAPTAVVGRYNLVRLDMPAYDAEKYKCLADKNCQDPKATGWPRGEVAVAVTTELRDKAPNVAAFLAKVQLPNDTTNKILAWADENKAGNKETAEYFLKNHEDIWTKWVPAEVAAKVKASL